MNIAIIPARGGSKRVPRKNIREFCGRPMIAWPIAAAQASGLFEHILVSTDDDEIADVAREAGAEVPFIRPASLADDYTTTGEVMVHALERATQEGIDIKAACCIYATAAFVSSEDLAEAHGLLRPDCDYSFSAMRYTHPPQRGFLRGDGGIPRLLEPRYRSTRTQDLPPVFYDAGQFYWGKREAWIERRPIFGQRSRFIELPVWRGIDIDRPEDWEMAERICAGHPFASK